MSPDEAHERICDALEQASLHPLSPAGRGWLLKWCYAGDRPEMLADEHGAGDVAHICAAITSAAGPMLNGMTHLAARVSRDPYVTGEALDPPMIAALELILSLSRTRLCTSLEELMA